MLLLTLMPGESCRADAGFTDVPSDSYYASAVTWAVAQGVTQGTSATTFSPEQICTRGQVVTFLWRVKGEPEPQSPRNEFADIPAGSYCEKAVMWAVEQGITMGTSESPKLFSPDKECTYAEIITFLWRSNGSPKPAFSSAMTQEWGADYYFKDAVTWGDNEALFEDEGGEFSPYQPCTRARTVAWLYRDSQVWVSNVRDLIGAIRPGRQIYLYEGTYDLTSWAKEIMTGVSRSTGSEYVTLDLVYDGVQVQLRGVKNLSILPAHPDDKVEIVVSPRYADVLSLIECDNIYFEGLTMGHTPEQGSCAGGVLYLEDCGRIAMSGMDLYGCGINGISANRTDSIQVVDSIIHDCSEGLLDFNRVKDAGFGNVEFRTCDGYTMLNLRESNVSFAECSFSDLKWEPSFCSFLSTDLISKINFAGCAFDDNVLANLQQDPGFNVNVQVS